jgi:hypothetical protein
VIAMLLGDRPHRVTPVAFDELYPAAAAAVGAPLLSLPFPGAAAPIPSLVAYLAARLGATVCAASEGLALQVGDRRRDQSIARRLADADGVIHLP